MLILEVLHTEFCIQKKSSLVKERKNLRRMVWLKHSLFIYNRITVKNLIGLGEFRPLISRSLGIRDVNGAKEIRPFKFSALQYFPRRSCHHAI